MVYNSEDEAHGVQAGMYRIGAKVDYKDEEGGRECAPSKSTICMTTKWTAP